MSFFIDDSSDKPRQQRDGFIYSRNRIDGKFVLPCRLHQSLLQHQVLNIGSGNNYSLLPSEPPGRADIEEAFDFLVHASHRLHHTELVDGACHRNALAQRYFSNSGQQRAEFRERRAIAVIRTIGLLEHQAGGQGQRLRRRVAIGQKSAQDHHALGMQRATRLRRTLDIHHLPTTKARVSTSGACGFNFTANVGEAVSTGFEFEAVAAVTDNLTLNAGFGYTDAEFTESVPAAGIVEGDRLTDVP